MLRHCMDARHAAKAARRYAFLFLFLLWQCLRLCTVRGADDFAQSGTTTPLGAGTCTSKRSLGPIAAGVMPGLDTLSLGQATCSSQRRASGMRSHWHALLPHTPAAACKRSRQHAASWQQHWQLGHIHKHLGSPHLSPH